MDQKRTIIIILSICVVAIVVTGVALWLLYPRANSGVANGTGPATTFVQGIGSNPTPSPETASSQFNGIGEFGGVNNQPTAQPSPLPGTSPAPVAGNQTVHNSQEVVIVYGNNPTYKTGPDGTLIKIDGTQPATGVLPLPSPQPSTGPAKELGKINLSVASPAPSPAASAKPAPSSAPRVSNANLTKTNNPRPSAAPSHVIGKEYWIQIISSPNRDRVDQVKHDLSALGFNGRVTTKSVSGVDYFRLRYGPYSRADEAQKFLDWVKAIKGFEQSYVAEEFPQPAK